MPSDSEKFLGIDDQARPPVPSPKGILTKRWVWVLLPVVSYPISVLWLTGAVVCVPYVIWMAPLGLTALFAPPENPANARVWLGPVEYAAHLVFWSLLLTGILGCKVIDRKILRLIFLILVIMIVLTMVGCARYYHMNTADFN